MRYLNGRAVSRLAFLADRPGFVWREPAARNALDRAVFDKLRAIKVQPSETSTDPVFLRRAYLDALGVLPTPEEARAFLGDPDPGKRARLVRNLVRRPEFSDFWALKWADLLRNEEKTMGEKGVWVFRMQLGSATVSRPTPRSTTSSANSSPRAAPPGLTPRRIFTGPTATP